MNGYDDFLKTVGNCRGGKSVTGAVAFMNPVRVLSFALHVWAMLTLEKTFPRSTYMWLATCV